MSAGTSAATAIPVRLDRPVRTSLEEDLMYCSRLPTTLQGRTIVDAARTECRLHDSLVAFFFKYQGPNHDTAPGEQGLPGISKDSKLGGCTLILGSYANDQLPHRMSHLLPVEAGTTPFVSDQGYVRSTEKTYETSYSLHQYLPYGERGLDAMPPAKDAAAKKSSLKQFEGLHTERFYRNLGQLISSVGDGSDWVAQGQNALESDNPLQREWYFAFSFYYTELYLGKVFETIEYSPELEDIVNFVYHQEAAKLMQKGMSAEEAHVELIKPRSSTFLRDLGDSILDFENILVKGTWPLGN